MVDVLIEGIIQAAKVCRQAEQRCADGARISVYCTELGLVVSGSVKGGGGHEYRESEEIVWAEIAGMPALVPLAASKVVARLGLAETEGEI